MDLNKLSTADKVIAGAGIVFFVSLFLPWWGKDFGGGISGSNSGWDYFLTGILPFLIVIVMIGQIAITKFTTTELPKIPVPWSQVHLAAGAAVAILLVLRTLIGSSEGSGTFEIDLDREWGLYVALLAAIGVGAGGYLKFQEGDSDESAVGSTPPTPF